MQWKVILREPTNCRAEGRYRGYLINVLGMTRPDCCGWTVAVTLRSVPPDGLGGCDRVLSTSGLLPRDADDVFAQGFALAMSHIDTS